MDDSGIEERMVDNPLTGFAQWRAEIEEHGAAYAGKVRAQVNMTTILGGFHKFYGSEAEQRACAIYKAAYEAALVGGARAVDPSREPVDGGWINPEAVFINGAEARVRLAAIDDHLGLMDTKRLRFVVIAEWGPTSYAKHFYGLRTPNAQAVSRAKVEVRRLAAKVAAFLDLTTEGRGTGVRGDSPQRTEFTTEGATISTRKVA